MVQRKVWIFEEDIGIPELDQGNGKSIDFNGTDERMDGTSTIGIANTWTISFWMKRTGGDSIMSIGFAVSGIVFRGASGIVDVKLGSVSGSPFLDQGFGATTSGWAHIVATWNGTTFRLWSNDSESAQSPHVPGAGSLSDGSREVSLATAPFPGDSMFAGRMGHVAIWSTVLTDDEITKVYTDGFDINLTYDQGDYASASTLVRYWRPGAQSGDIGQDYEGSLDLALNNISAADIVTDSP
jgi:hypothetical protein